MGVDAINVDDFNYSWDGTVNGTVEQNGTKDMMGNVSEWNETITSDIGRGTRGIFGSQSGFRQSSVWWRTESTVGFRVSQVPEPASLGLLGLGVMGMLVRRRGAGR